MVAGKERDFSGYCNRCIASHLSQWNSRGLNAFATYEGCVVCISVMLYREKTGVTEGTFVRATRQRCVCRT